MTKIKLPHISDEDRQHLSYTPNIDDLVDWIADFATQAVTEDRAQRDAQLAKPEPATPAWRCFHCDEVFTERNAAQEHFGSSQLDQPFCQLDAEYIRWLQAQHRRNVDDDSEALRTILSLVHEHETLRKRAEEAGYARGLADAKRYCEELGLQAIHPQAPQVPMGDLEAVAVIQKAGFKTWSPMRFSLIRLTEAHHGIKEQL